MEFREHTALGRTGLQVSRLGIGCSYGAPDYSIEKAYHGYGVNFFYWGAMRRSNMKKVLRKLVRSERDKLVIALQSFDRTGPLLNHFLNKGLKSLGTDHADILILGSHSKAPSQRILNAALKAREQGKVRFLAMSSHNRSLVGEMVQRTDLPIDVYMIRYNAAHRGAETDIFPHLPDENGPGIIAFTATRWGHLVNARKMPPGERPMAPADCYRFVLSNPNVDLCMTGPKTAHEMTDALMTLDTKPMSEEELERARRIGDYVYSKGRRN